MKTLFRTALTALFCASTYRLYHGLECTLNNISVHNPNFLQNLEFVDERSEALRYTMKIFPNVKSLKISAFYDLPESSRVDHNLMHETWVQEALEFHLALENPCHLQTKEEVMQTWEKSTVKHWVPGFSGNPHLINFPLKEREWTQVVTEARIISTPTKTEPACQVAPHSRLYTEKLKENIQKSKGTFKNYRNPMSNDGNDVAFGVAAASLATLGITACFSRNKNEEKIEMSEDQPGAAPLSARERLHQRLEEFKINRRSQRSI